MPQTIQKIREIFNRWNFQKQNIHTQNIYPYFRKGEIRWVFLGQNIGSESYGKGKLFTRPVLILKKIYGNAAIVLPLSSKIKKGDYYFTFTDSENKKHCALLTQIRYLDGKRIKDKMSFVSQKTMQKVQSAHFALIQK